LYTLCYNPKKGFKVKFLFSILICSTFLFSADKTDIILQEIKSIKEDIKDIKIDIKVLREDMNKRFEQVDKRFEQVDKRFEQVDKRLDFMQNILYVLMGLIFASPFIAIYLRDKKEAEERKLFDSLKGVIIVLREMADDNEKIKKSLKATGLL
jgi:septal ring factor EnvC (AmiA/AmiB activator)